MNEVEVPVCSQCNLPMRPSSAIQGAFWCQPCRQVHRAPDLQATVRRLQRRPQAHLNLHSECSRLGRRLRDALTQANGYRAPWNIINGLVAASSVLDCATALDSLSAQRAAAARAHAALDGWEAWAKANLPSK
jgi:hypothetical protein